MKSRRGLIFSGVSLILCAVLWTAAVGAQAGIYARSTKVLPHTGYSAEGLPLTIPDLTTVESPLEVSEAVTVEDVNVLINLTHTYDGDLQIALVSPSGTEVILANHVGGSGNNFTNTVFDDEAMSPIGSGAAPFTGAFQPSQPLAGLDGTTGQGTWRLVVRDQMGSDTGVLLNWRLILNAQSDLVDSYHYVPDTSADWLVTDGRLRAGIGEGHPAHNSASINLADFNWSLNPAKRQNWSLDVAKRNEWGGWMDLNRPAVSGWLEGRYSCAYVLACDKADFTDPTARGYAIGFKAGGSSPLVLFRFDAGINSGALQLPASTTEIVQSGYNYLDSDDGVNFYVQLMPDGRWAVRWKSGSVLPTESVFEATSYTAQAMSTVTDTTYQGYDFKYAGWVYAHSVSSLAYAYFDNLGAGLTANDFNAPALGTFDAPAYAKAPFSVSYAGVTDNRSGVAQVELWARHESQTEWAQAGVLASASGSFPVFPNQGDGVYGFSLVMVDRDGNRSAEPTSVTAPLDTTLFDTTAPVAGPVTATLYSSTSLEVAYSGTTDTLSGLASAQLWYSYNDQNSWTALSGMTTSTSSAVFTLTPSTPSFTLNEGVYYWGFVVTDNAGNTTSTASGSGVAISYFDTTPPTSGSLLAPQYATGGPIAVSYGGFLDAISGLREVQLGYRFLDVTTPTWVFDPIYTTASATGEFLFNPTLGDGTYEFQVRAWDNAGNSVQAASSVQTILDSVAPIPGILSMPAAFFYNTPQVSLTYSGAGDSGSGLKTIYLLYRVWDIWESGGLSGWLDSAVTATASSGTLVFDVPVDLYSQPINALYLFDLVAVDHAGNVSLFPGLSEYGDVWFHEDTVAPNSGTVSAPEYANTAPFSVSYSGVMDSFSGVTTVTLYSNSWSNPIGTVWYLDSGSVSYTPPSDGIYTFGLRASDLAENMAENPTSVTTIYDTTAPTTAALSVAALTSGTVIPVTCTTFPEDVLSGVERVELWYNVNGTTWTASGLTIATTGTVVNFTPPAGVNGVYEFGTVAEDLAGNVTAIPPDAATSSTYDNQAPVVGTLIAPGYTSVSLIAIQYSGFSDAGLGLADVRLWYRVGALGAWTASPTEFSTVGAGTFNYTALADGTYYFAVVAQDPLGNSTPLPTVAGAMDSTVYDTVAPTVVSITPSNAGPISSPELDFNVVFSEPVQGFDPTLQLVLEVAGSTTVSTATLTGSGNTYTAHVTGITGNGALRLQVLSAVAGGVRDLAGNLLAGGMTSAWVGNDSTPPSVLSVNRKTPLGALTSATQVTFEVVFDEPVRDVAKEDFALEGTYAQTSASLLSVSGVGTTWAVVVNTADGTGTLSLDVTTAGPLRDVAGNALATAFTAGQTYLVDREAPYVTAITRETPAEADTSATAVTFKVAFNEPIFTTLTASHFTIEASGAQEASVVTTVTSVASTSATWLVSVATAPGKGDLGIALTNVAGIVDQVGLGMTQPFSNQSEVYHVDRGNPVVTSILRYDPADSRTSATEVLFLLSFNEPVTGVSTDTLSINATDGQVSATLVEVLNGGGDSSTYTIRVAPALLAGRLGVNVDRNLSDIQDAFGNPMTTSFTQSQKYDVNGNAPTLARAIPTAGTTVASLAEVIAVFDNQVAGVAAGNLIVNGSVATTVTALGYHMYRFEGFAEPADGAVSVELAAGDIADLYGNAFAGDSWTYVKDSAALTVSLASSDVINGGSSKFDAVYMTATFSAPVTGFNAATDITVTNGWVDNFIANSTTEYEFFVHPTAVGEVTVQIGFGMAQTIAAPPVLNVASTVFAFSHDNVPTTVEAIERFLPAAPLTNAAAVVYRVVFSEPVRGPAKTNFTAVGTDGQTTASVASVAVVDPTALGYSNMWDVTVNTVDNSTGTLKINLVNNLSRITDMAGNSMQIAAAFTAGESYLVDRVKPQLINIENYLPVVPVFMPLTNAQQVVFRYTFDTPVRGVKASMFTTQFSILDQVSGSIAGVTPVGGSPATQWLVTANTVDDGMGSIFADLPYFLDEIQDEVGNSVYQGGSFWNPSSNAFWCEDGFLIDRVDPTVVSIVCNEVSPTSASLVSFTVTFNESVTGVGTDSFSIDATGDEVGAMVLSVTPLSPSAYQVVVGTVPGKGALSVDLSNTAGIVDQVGNTMSAAFTNGAVYAVDRQGPMVVSIERFDPATAATSATQVSFLVTFDESVSSVTLENFAIDATSNQAALTSAALQSVVNQGDGTTWTLTVETAKGLGWLSVDLTTTTGIVDVQGNELLLPFLAGEYYEINRVPFCVAINRFDPQDVVTSASQVTFQALFSDDVNNVTVSDFAVDATGGQAGATILGVSGAGTTWTVTVNTVDMAQGFVSVDFAATVGVTDNLGNTISGTFTAGEVYEVNRVAPQLLSIERYNPLDAATSASQVVFKATFSQPVVSVTEADFEVSLASTFDQIGAYVDAVTGTSTTWYVQVQTSSGIGDLGIELVQPSAVTDGAGNPVADIAPAVNEMYSVDRLPVVLAVRRHTPLDPNTNAEQVVFEVSFNDRVLYVGTDNFSIDATDAEVAALVNSVTSDPSGENWFVTVDTAPGVGALSVDLDANLSDIEDVVGYPLTTPFTAGEFYLVDREGSTVTVNQSVAQADPTSGSIAFDVVFNDPAWGFTTASVQFAGTATVTSYTVTGADGDTTYTIEVTGVSSDGTVVAVIPAGAALDANGNGNLLSTSTDNSVTYDSTPPSVTVEQAAAQADPTSVSTLVFDVAFSEPVWGFDALDVNLSGTAGSGSVAITAGSDGDTTYTVTVTGLTSDGSVEASVPANAVVDVIGFPNTASTSVDNEVTYDATWPEVTIEQAAGQADPTNGVIAFEVTFSEPVWGFSALDVNLSGTAGGGSVAVVLGSEGDSVYRIEVTGLTSDGVVEASVATGAARDAAGNLSAPSTSVDNWVLYDTTPPQVASIAPQAGLTLFRLDQITVTFSEPVMGVSADMLSVAGSSATALVGGGEQYTFSGFTPPADGLVAVVLAGTIVDAAGNVLTGANWSYEVDSTPLTVALVSTEVTSGGYTNVATTSFTAVFSEPVVNFVVSDIVATTGTISGFVLDGGTTATFAVTAVAEQVMTVEIPAGVADAADVVGKVNETSGVYAYTYDITPPEVVDIVPATTGPTSADAVDFTVTFSEPVTGFGQVADVTVNHAGTASTGVQIAALSASQYTVSVEGLSGDGSFSLSVNPSGAADYAGNASLAGGPSAAVLVDNTNPDVTEITPSTTGPTNADSVVFTVAFSEPVSGFAQAADVTVGATGTAAAAGVALAQVSPTTYTVTLSGLTGDGTLALSVNESSAADVAGNPNNPGGPSAAVLVDNTAPTVVAVVPAADSVVESVTSVSVTLSEAVVGLSAGDLTLNGVTATAVSGANPYVFTGFGLVPDGAVEAVLASVALDGAGNALAQTSWTFTVQSPIPLTVALDSVDVTSGSFTNLASVDFVTTFSEPVDGLTTASITALNATIESVVALTSRTFAFVAVPQGDGLVTVQIPAGVTTATLAAGRTNVASDVFPFQFDTTAPVLGGAPVDEGALTSSTQLMFAWVVATDAGAGVATYEYQLAADPSFATVVTSGTLPATQEMTTLTGADGLTWYLRIRATDALGNTSGFSDASDGIRVDTTAPTVVAILPSTLGPTTATAVDFGVFFSEPVFGFGDAGDLTVNVTGSVTYTTVSVTQVSTTSYTATVAGIAGEGSLTIQAVSGAGVDLAGNASLASLPSPTVWIGGEVPAPVMVAEPPYTPGTQNTVSWSVVAGAVSYTVEVAADAAFTTAVTSQTVTATEATFAALAEGVEYFYRVYATTPGGSSAWSNTVSSTQDATAPAVTLLAQVADPTSVALALVTATFSEDVTGFALDDLVTTQAAVTTLTQVNASTYTFWVTAQTSGTVAIQVMAGAALDRAGNASAASAVTAWTLDQTAPAALMASTASDPTSLTVIPVSVTFSEPVTGFTADDIVTSNATVANFVAGADGTTYTANLMVTLTDDGMVTADIAAGAAFDLAGNPNTTATQLMFHYMKSLTPPTVVLSTPAGFATNTAPIPVTVTFDQAVTGFTLGDAVVVNGSAGNFTAVSETVYTFDVTPDAEGFVTVDVDADVAFNSKGVGNLAAEQLSVIYDITAPTVAMASTAGDPTTATAIPLSVTFAEPVTGFTADDIVTSNATVANFVAGADGTTYTADLMVTLTDNGLVTADIAAGAAFDLAGNPNTTATQLTRHFALSGAEPTVVISTPAGFATNAAPIPVTVTFSQAVTGFQIGDVTVDNGTVTNFAAASGSVYTFDVAPASEGAVTINVPADVALNAFGKGNLAAAPLSVTYDITAPTVTLLTQVDDPTTQPVVSVTATFSEPVSELTPSVISVLGATVSNLVTVDVQTYTFDVTALGTGDVAVQVQAGVVQDAADNGNLPSNVLTWTVDTEAPTPTLTSPVSATSDTLIPAQVAFNEPVFGFSVEDLVTVEGVAIENFAAVDASATTFTFDLRVSLKENAALTVNVPAAVCEDVAGNANLASNQLVIAYEYNPENFALEAPLGVTASDGAYTYKVAVSWQSVAGAAFYKVYRTAMTTETAALEEVTGWIADLSIDDEQAEPGVQYLYQVRAAANAQGSRQSDLSAPDAGWIEPTETPTVAWYKIQYANCTLDAESTSASLMFTGTSLRSYVKITLLPKGKPARATDIPGRLLYRQIEKLESVEVDGDLRAFYTMAEVENFEAVGSVKSISTKAANIGFINAGQLGAVRINATRDATAAAPEFASTSIYSTGSSDVTARVALTGTILRDLSTTQPVSYVKSATKKYQVKVGLVRENRISLGGIGPVLRVVNDLSGVVPALPVPLDSVLDAPKIATVSVSGSALTPDSIGVGAVQKVTAAGGVYRVTRPGLFTSPASGKVVLGGNVRVRQIVSTVTVNLIQAKSKVYNGVAYGGFVGYMGAPAYEQMTVLAPNIKTVSGLSGVGAILIAGYNTDETEEGPVYTPNFTGFIKKIASKRVGGQLWGEAYLNPAVAAKIVFSPKDHPNFVVNPID